MGLHIGYDCKALAQVAIPQRQAKPVARAQVVVVAVQRCDGRHVGVRQLEIEDGEVFLELLLADGLGNGTHAALVVPAQHHLGRRLVVLLANLNDGRLCDVSLESQNSTMEVSTCLLKRERAKSGK